MNLLLNLVIDLFAGVVNVAAIRWPETSIAATVPKSELEGRVGRSSALLFLGALVVIPLALMGWVLS